MKRKEKQSRGIRLESQDLAAFRTNIAAWEAMWHDADREGDYKTASTYAKDAVDLRLILRSVEENDYITATETIDRLDTIVRDQIPTPLYNELTQPAITELDLSPDTIQAMSLETRLQYSARILVGLLGDETAAAVAAKCQPVYGKHPADHESTKLTDAIVESIGVDRYNALEML